MSGYGTEGHVTEDSGEGQSLTTGAPPAYQQTPVYAAAPSVQPMYAQPVGQPQQVYSSGPAPVVYGSQQPAVVYAQPGAGVQFVDQSGRTVIVQSAPVPVPVQYAMSGPCGCSVGCCSGYLTYTLIVMLFLSWIGAIVCWNSSMHEIDFNDLNSQYQFFSTKLVYTSSSGGVTTTFYKDLSSGDSFGACFGGGIAVIVLAVIAFILLSLSIGLIFYRISRVNGSYWFGGANNRGPINADQVRELTARESSVVTLSFLLYLTISIVWGSTCVHAATNYVNRNYQNQNVSIPFTGYGYFIFCVILMVSSLVHSLVIRQNIFYQTMGRVIPGMPQYSGQVQQQQMVVMAQPAPQAVVYQ